MFHGNQTSFNIIQHHATWWDMVAKRVQHVAFNNFERWWIVMLHSFGQKFTYPMTNNRTWQSYRVNWPLQCSCATTCKPCTDPHTAVAELRFYKSDSKSRVQKPCPAICYYGSTPVITSLGDFCLSYLYSCPHKWERSLTHMLKRLKSSLALCTILRTRSVSSDIQTPRRELKNEVIAEFFNLVRSVWTSDEIRLSSVWYYISNESVFNPFLHTVVVQQQITTTELMKEQNKKQKKTKNKRKG